jgi:hypothetical protein
MSIPFFLAVELSPGSVLTAESRNPLKRTGREALLTFVNRCVKSVYGAV